VRDIARQVLRDIGPHVYAVCRRDRDFSFCEKREPPHPDQAADKQRGHDRQRHEDEAGHRFGGEKRREIDPERQKPLHEKNHGDHHDYQSDNPDFFVRFQWSVFSVIMALLS